VSDTGTVTTVACKSTPYAVGTQVILPLVFFLLITSIIFMYWKYTKLHRIREQNKMAGYSPAVADAYGGFVAGGSSAEYSVCRDVCPYIVPSCLHRFCFTEQLNIKLLLSLACSMLLTAAILIPLGLWTTSPGHSGDFLPDPSHILSAGWWIFISALGLCCCTGCFRSCGSNQVERQQRYLQMPQREQQLDHMELDVPMAAAPPGAPSAVVVPAPYRPPSPSMNSAARPNEIIVSVVATPI